MKKANGNEWAGREMRSKVKQMSVARATWNN